jgi:hypothetical protein
LKTDEYKGEELFKIFVKKIKDSNWSLEEKNIEDNNNKSINKNWFIKNEIFFKFFGRDVETLLSKTKITHSKRVFCKPKEEKKIIKHCDLEKGFDLFIKNENIKKRKEENGRNKLLNSMYI